MSGGKILPNGRILRYSVKERVIHWIVGLSYLYLLLTGLAFFTPRLYWLANLVGGGPTARAWHPWAGVIFALGVLWMYRIWGKDMRFTDSDRAWFSAVGHYIRNEDEQVPQADRFNGGQKQLFWLMFWGGLLLLLSGLILWFPEYIPWNLRLLRYIAVLVHPIAALLTIGGFIIHVYMGTAMERGAFSSMVRGEVSRAWAKAFHEPWLRQLESEQTPKK